MQYPLIAINLLNSRLSFEEGTYSLCCRTSILLGAVVAPNTLGASTVMITGGFPSPLLCATVDDTPGPRCELEWSPPVWREPVALDISTGCRCKPWNNNGLFYITFF